VTSSLRSLARTLVFLKARSLRSLTCITIRWSASIVGGVGGVETNVLTNQSPIISERVEEQAKNSPRERGKKGGREGEEMGLLYLKSVKRMKKYWMTREGRMRGM